MGFFPSAVGVFSGLQAESRIGQGDFSIGAMMKHLELLIRLRAAMVQDDGGAGNGSAKYAVGGGAEIKRRKAQLILRRPLNEFVGGDGARRFAIVDDKRTMQLRPFSRPGDVQAVSVLRAVQAVGEAQIIPSQLPLRKSGRRAKRRNSKDGKKNNGADNNGGGMGVAPCRVG